MTTLTQAELTKLLASNPDVDVIGDYDLGRNVALGAPKMTGKRQEPEHLMQVAIFAEIDRRALTDDLWLNIFAIPNGGHRHPAVAEKLKAEGVRAGVPDIFVALPRMAGNVWRHGLFVECKVHPNGPTEAQIEWARRLRVANYVVETIYDDPALVIAKLEWWIEG